MGTSKDDPFVGLSAEIARHEEHLGRVDERLSRINTDVTHLAKAVSQLQLDRSVAAGGDGEEERRIEWWWPSMSAAEAGACWSELVAWVRIGPGRYPGLAEALRKCWYRHPAVLDWMTGLYLAWKDAYSRPPMSSSREEWLDRWLRPATSAVGELLNDCRSRCTMLEHRGMADLSLDEHVRADIGMRQQWEAAARGQR